jgi:hypothetical protein
MLITLYGLFQAFFIMCGMWVNAKLLWMLIYQIKYGKDYGERYIRGLISKEEKAELKRNFKGWRKK